MTSGRDSDDGDDSGAMDLDSGATTHFSSEDSEKPHSSVEKREGRARSGQPNTPHPGARQASSAQLKKTQRSRPRLSRAERIIRKAQQEDEETAMLRFRCAQVSHSSRLWMDRQLTQTAIYSSRLSSYRRMLTFAQRKRRCKMRGPDSTSPGSGSYYQHPPRCPSSNPPRRLRRCRTLV